MDLQKFLDQEIRKDEMRNHPQIKWGYRMAPDREPYPNYMENQCWAEFVSIMQNEYKTAFKEYGKGSGNELNETQYPPKMASAGSSSRMIYTHARDIDGFVFEQKLPTTIGGISNMDGFLAAENKEVFVEAKCREIYGAKAKNIELKYQQFYQFINGRSETKLGCDIENEDQVVAKSAKNMEVQFFYDKEKIEHFDMKQMLCHLLGVATRMLKKETLPEEIRFLYMLYNPTLLPIEEGKDKDKLMAAYGKTCKEIEDIDFIALFKETIVFLQTEKGLGPQHNPEFLARRFTFTLVDQNTFESEL